MISAVFYNLKGFPPKTFIEIFTIKILVTPICDNHCLCLIGMTIALIRILLKLGKI